VVNLSQGFSDKQENKFGGKKSAAAIDSVFLVCKKMELPLKIDRQLINRRLIDRRLIDRRLIDRRLIDPYN
jgi:hypothetical protein